MKMDTGLAKHYSSGQNFCFFCCAFSHDRGRETKGVFLHCGDYAPLILTLFPLSALDLSKCNFKHLLPNSS